MHSSPWQTAKVFPCFKPCNKVEKSPLRICNQQLTLIQICSPSSLYLKPRLRFKVALGVWYPSMCMCPVIWSYLILCDPMDCSRQAPLSMGFSSQEYWRGLPFPALGDLPDPEIQLASPVLAGGFFTTAPPRKPLLV